MTADKENGGFSLRKFALPLVAGALGLVVVLTLAPRISPVASVEFSLSRGEVMERGRTALAGLGYSTGRMQQDAVFNFGSSAHLFMQAREGMEAANAMVRADTLPIHYWRVTWYDRSLTNSQNKEGFKALVSPGGRLLGFDHQIGDTVSLPSVSADSALSLAEAALSRFTTQARLYSLKTSSSVNQLHRSDHHFVFSRSIGGMDLKFDIRVQGNEVGGVEWTVSLPDDFLGRLNSLATTMTLVTAVSMAGTFLLFFYVVVLFLKKYHEGEVGTRTGLLVFVVFFVCAVLSAVNEFAGAGSSVMIGDLNKFNVRLVTFAMNVFVVQVFLGVLVFASWSVGESSSRSVWAPKLISTDSVLYRKLFTVDVAGAVVRGYGWGCAILGVHALLALLFVRGRNSLFVLNVSGVPESILPALQPILYGIVTAVFTEVVLRLFFLSHLRERFRSDFPGIIVSVVVWTLVAFFFYEVPFGTPAFWSHVLVLVVYGIVFAALFLRYDLLTAICAQAVIVAVNSAIPLLVSHNNVLIWSPALFGALFVLPLIGAVVGFSRRESFAFAPTTMPTHIQRISDRVRMVKELEIARSVQMSLLPKEQPRHAGFDIAGTCIPALEVGGDYFDFVSLGSGKLGIALGDVSGKGVPAAIYMTLTKGILQSHAEENVTPRAVLSKVNSLMYRTIERNSFVSMLYAVLDLDNAILKFSRAGQCPVVLAQDLSGRGAFITPKGMALGLEKGEVFDAVLEEVEVPLHLGETVVFYTDGFTEAMDEQEEEFGDQRLVDSITRHRQDSAQKMIQAICDDVRVFTGSAPQHDDMTMVVLKRVGA